MPSMHGPTDPAQPADQIARTPVTGREIINVLESAALKAGELALRLQPTAELKSKGRFDRVTNGDTEAQRVSIEELRAHFPHIHIVAEESENPRIEASTYLTDDPIDGTTLYSKLAKDWANLLGYVLNGAPEAGVLNFPARQELITAVRGEGCFLNGKRVKFSGDASLETSIVGVELAPFGNEVSFEVARILGRNSLGVRSHLSAASTAADIIRGTSDLYFHDCGAKVWDFVPSVVAIEAAGGFCCAVDGSPLKWDKIPMGIVMASSRRILDEFLEATRHLGLKAQ